MLNMKFPVRINKYIALKGWASRREADELIKARKIFVNNQPAVIGQSVLATDKVNYRGQKKAKDYLAYYKGRGVITHSPASGEIDIATKLHQQFNLTNAHPIGRLDKNSEGLIILSNDGRLTEPLTSPEFGTEKEYAVTVDKNITPRFLKKMGAGVDIEGYLTKPAKIKQKSARSFLLTLTEGKKHQIRRMCAALGYQVKALTRIRIANIKLGNLKPNQYRKLKNDELKKLLTWLRIS